MQNCILKCKVVFVKFSFSMIYQECFSNPKSLFRDLHTLGFHAIWMLDPGIKCEPGYFVYDSGSENDVWVLKENLESYVGQ